MLRSALFVAERAIPMRYNGSMRRRGHQVSPVPSVGRSTLLPPRRRLACAALRQALSVTLPRFLAAPPSAWAKRVSQPFAVQSPKLQCSPGIMRSASAVATVL
jgi:hypothetical protein